ncbi:MULTISPECIES: hypothetical protein [Pseudomonas]|uniref:hypothetical protein n=1 Tax=Pseudomonas TaxID=286 RepID=UPI000A9F37C7|nr:MULTISPECIES: hypothetical protein [Pseudomonas]MDU4254050.1 hypothetical protein [Pseudomonas sp.]
MTNSLTEFAPEAKGTEWDRAKDYVKDSRPITQVKKLDIKGAVESFSFATRPRDW